MEYRYDELLKAEYGDSNGKADSFFTVELSMSLKTHILQH